MAVGDIHEGLIDVDYCHGTRYTLEELPAAIEAAREQGHGKVKLLVDLTQGADVRTQQN